MSLVARGKVFLAGYQFTTDPTITRSWPPRRGRLPTIGGGVTQQDFGRWAKDMRLTLVSHDLNLMSLSLKAAIDSLMLTRKAAYTYTDFQGIDADVVIVDFEPRPTYHRDGQGVLYEYSLTLDVVRLRELDFVAYADGALPAGPPLTDVTHFEWSAVADYAAASDTINIAQITAMRGADVATDFAGTALLSLVLDGGGGYPPERYFVDGVYVAHGGSFLHVSAAQTPHFVAGKCLADVSSGDDRLGYFLRGPGFVSSARVHLVATAGGAVGSSDVFIFSSI